MLPNHVLILTRPRNSVCCWQHHQRGSPHLDKSTLTELGLNSIGHRIKILNHIKTLTPSATSTATKATVHAQLTTVTSEMTQSQFRQFENDWRAYKQLLNLLPQQLVSHLYNACDETVRNTITNSHPDFLNTTEVLALATIKKIVTRKVNPAVHLHLAHSG